MERLQVPLVDESGHRIGWGGRWETHRVREGPVGPVLGKKHIGITIILANGKGKILVAHRRHKIFDKVWTLSGDTHPYRYDWGKTEVLSEAARRCAMDDLGVITKGWRKALTLSYAAQDPRDPRYCENELLRVMVTRYDGPIHMNEKNAYEAQWTTIEEIADDSSADAKKKPIERKYAPWVHATFALPSGQVKRAIAT